MHLYLRMPLTVFGCQGLQNSTLAAVWPCMDLSSAPTDREAMTNMFLQEYMQKFVERTDMSDADADKNTEDVIREAIHMHHQVPLPLPCVCKTRNGP